MNKKLDQAVSFALWCQREAVAPRDAAELLALAKKAKTAGERHCNAGTQATEDAEVSAATKFARRARELGYETDWPGLWPVLRKDGRDVYLPEID